MGSRPDASGWSGRRATKAKAWCQANYGWLCWLCGHQIEDGDYSVDHVVPRSIRPDLTWDPTNWRPAHRTKKRQWGCPGNSGRGNGMRRKRPAQVVTAPGW